MKTSARVEVISEVRTGVSGTRIQRCGQSGCPCAEHEGYEVQRSGAGSAGTVGDAVRDVFREPGQPLDGDTRGRFQQSLGHDFGDVRVHTGGLAARSTALLTANAWTAGTHIVFAPGRYEPGTEAGRRLLTHELTHVVQQRQSGPRPAGVTIDDSPAAEKEAQRAAEEFDTDRIPTPPTAIGGGIQRQIDPSRFQLLPDAQLQAPPPLRPGSIPEAYVIAPQGAPAEVRLDPPSALSPPQPRSLFPDLQLQLPPLPTMILFVPRCVPDRPLIWVDFGGSPSGSAQFAAKTVSRVSELSVPGNPMFQARLDGAASWVRPRFANPTDRTRNGCQSHVNRCSQFLRQAQPGSFWEFGGQPDLQCPAAVVPAQVRANTVAECDSVGAECDRAMGADSARLLRHEQGHFDVTCRLVHKANDALRAGATLDVVRAALNANTQPIHNRYDSDTNHGCGAARQSTWDTDIANGLPGVTIP